MLVLAAATTLGAGCHPQTKAPEDPSKEAPRLPATTIADESFGEAVHRLLRHGEATPERSALLAGTVRRQLAHASALLKAGHEVRATQAVVGALYLLRTGEARPDMIGPESLKALRGAMERFSARGDEGRAMALMMMLAEALPPGSDEQEAIGRHLASLRRWMAETRTGGDMARLAADERAAIGRALLSPEEGHVAEAEQAIHAWVRRAVQYNLTYQKTRKLPPRREISEAYRALQSGAETMAALHLRFGRADHALRAIERTAAGSVAEPDFFARIRAAAVDDTAEDWRMLARRFARIAANGDQSVDQALVEAALWGIALEAYRRDPTSQAVAHLLAEQLIELEMPSAAPLVLSSALGPRPPAVALNAAMSKLAEALVRQLDGGTAAPARRTFAAASPVLEIADNERYQDRVQPSSATLRQIMAAIELRDGRADRAHPLLVKALTSSPSVRGFRLLATLERQMGDLQAALRHARRATSLPEAKQAPLDVVETKLLEHELLHALEDSDANAPLQEALELLLGAQPDDIAAKIRAERLLGRTLDHYGARRRAARAYERALDLASRHRPALAQTVLETVGRALVQGEVDAARAALQVGIKADLERDDLVYGALWLMFLERGLDEGPDGKVDRLLFDAVDGESWTATLARWARGRIDDDALQQAAGNQAERTEARFYIAMRARTRGEPSAAQKLEKVARSPLVDLMEVQIARDLLAPKSSEVELPEQLEQAVSARD